MRSALVFVALVLGGCAFGPDYERPELDTPVAYLQPVDDGESIVNLKWWELFEDPALEALIATALENNQDLGVATSRIEEFRAILGVTRSVQFPTVDIAGTAGRTSPSGNAFPAAIHTPVGTMTYTRPSVR